MTEKELSDDDTVMIPYKVGEWLDRVGTLEEGQNQIAERLGKLEEGQCRIGENVKTLKEDVGTLKEDVKDIKEHLLNGESEGSKGLEGSSAIPPSKMAAQSQD